MTTTTTSHVQCRYEHTSSTRTGVSLTMAPLIKRWALEPHRQCSYFDHVQSRYSTSVIIIMGLRLEMPVN